MRSRIFGGIPTSIAPGFLRWLTAVLVVLAVALVVALLADHDMTDAAAARQQCAGTSDENERSGCEFGVKTVQTIEVWMPAVVGGTIIGAAWNRKARKQP